MLKNPPFYSSHLLSNNPHGFFTAQGGVSKGGYCSLNCAHNTNDNLENVSVNCNRVLGVFGKDEASLRYLTQIHSNIIKDVRDTINGDKADGIISSDPNLFIAVTAADCLPVLLSAEDGAIVGAIHAGWRGIANHILEKAIDAFKQKGASVKSIHAAIGPSIAQQHYEIGDDMLDSLYKGDSHISRFVEKTDRHEKYLLNLQAWAAARLRAQGVRQCHNLEIDTYDSQNRCFSHRYGTHHELGAVGRQISLIAACPQ